MGHRGFSLVELVIVGAIMSVLVGGIAFVISKAGNNVWAGIGGKLSRTDEANRAIQRLTKELRPWSQANLQCIAGDPSDPTDDQLVFTDGDGVPQFIYHLSGTNLVRTQTGVDQVMAPEMTAFVPTCQPNGIVKLQITAAKDTSTGPTSQTLESQVWMRNP